VAEIDLEKVLEGCVNEQKKGHVKNGILCQIYLGIKTENFRH